VRISNVHVFIAPNFGVKQALRQALHSTFKREPTITFYEVGNQHKRMTAMFNAEYEIGDQGNKTKKKVVGTIFLHSELDSAGELVIPYIDIDCEEEERSSCGAVA
jgi:hypothetical protein